MCKCNCFWKIKFTCKMLHKIATTKIKKAVIFLTTSGALSNLLSVSLTFLILLFWFSNISTTIVIKACGRLGISSSHVDIYKYIDDVFFSACIHLHFALFQEVGSIIGKVSGPFSPNYIWVNLIHSVFFYMFTNQCKLIFVICLFNRKEKLLRRWGKR